MRRRKKLRLRGYALVWINSKHKQSKYLTLKRIHRLGERKPLGFIKERDILRKAAKYFAQRDKLVIRFRFACDHRTVYSVKRMCQVLKINRSSFYKWCVTNPRREEKTREDKKLAARIKAVFDQEKRGLYGGKKNHRRIKRTTGYLFR